MKSFFPYLGLFLSLGTTLSLGILYFQKKNEPQDRAHSAEAMTENSNLISSNPSDPSNPPPHAELIYSWTSKLNADSIQRRIHVEPTSIWTEDFALLQEDLFYDFLDEMLEKNLIREISLPIEFPKKTRQEWLEFGVPSQLLKTQKALKRVEIHLK